MRILVLTEGASLAIALSQLPFAHDIVAIDDIEQLEGHDLSFQVALVDLGSTRRGLVGASDVIRAGVSAPCLVVGDESPIELAVELAPDASVIVSPFSLEELDARLAELATSALRTTPEPSEHEFVTRDPGLQEHARVELAQRLLDEAAEVERLAPEVTDRRAVAEGLLQAVERELRPLVSVLWVPAKGGGYEPLAGRHLDGDERVPFDQSLFLSFETNLDAMLVVDVDPSRHPVAGIPGIPGETLIAAALRMGEDLQGVVMAAGEGYTEVERDQLQVLAAESAPALAVAEIFERLRTSKHAG